MAENATYKGGGAVSVYREVGHRFIHLVYFKNPVFFLVVTQLLVLLMPFFIWRFKMKLLVPYVRLFR